jgi:hypothetical protein
MIVKKINQLKNKKELISIERRSVTDEEIMGYVQFNNSEVIVVRTFTNEGYFDGFSLFEIDQINEIFWGNREHKSINNLIKENKEKRPEYPSNFSFENFKDGLIAIASYYDFIEIFCENFSARNFDIAKILEHDEEWLKLDCLGNKNTLSKMKRLLKIENITRIDFDTPYTKNIMKLHGIK